VRRETYTIIHDVDDSPFFDCIRDLEELLVHFHTCWFCVVAEAEADYAGFLAQLDFISLRKGRCDEG
jgi:hypothetical protein